MGGLPLRLRALLLHMNRLLKKGCPTLFQVAAQKT